MGEHQADAEDEAEVADAIDQESLHVGENGGRAGVPEADQQVGDEADSFPTEEELHEVVAHDEHQHREGKQRDVAEEAVVARIVLHVANGVDVHHQRHEGDDQHHRGGQGIDQEPDLEPVVAARQPGIDRAVEGVPGLDVLEDDDRGGEGDGDTGDRHGVRDPAGNDPTEEAGDRRAEEWRERNQEIELLHFHV